MLSSVHRLQTISIIADLSAHLKSVAVRPKRRQVQGFSNKTIVNTGIRTTYRSISQYNVTAGVGAFDPSMVSSYIRLRQNSQPGYTLKILDYSAQALVYSLLSNPVHATVQTPIACKAPECDAYLLSSGLYLSTPWPPTDHSTSPVVELHNLIARHLEFEKGPQIADIFDDNDCTAYGDNGATLIAIRFCLAQDARTDGIFTAGT